MKIINILTKSIEKIITVLFITMTIITFIQVLSRYIFGASFFWAEEIGRFSMIWIAFLGAAVGVSKGAHTRIDFFINLLPRNIKKWVEVLNHLICMGFVVVLIYNIIPVISITMKNLSPGLKIPMGVVYSSLFISGLLMVVYFPLRIYEEIKWIEPEGGVEI